MELEFYKYQGTGNDFVIIDNRRAIFPKNDTKLVAQLCDRKFGIGADGLILLEPHSTCDFTMVYYNADGNLSSMCGNGGRCVVHFARHLGVIKETAVFEAVDGEHEATIKGDSIRLKMNDVAEIFRDDSNSFLNTGSPHHVQLVDNLKKFPVYLEGKRIRNEVYGEAGANINFVTQTASDTFLVRTYERGVEDETLSCGTGVTAVALAMHNMGKSISEEIKLQTPGGALTVSFKKNGQGGYQNIYLTGPATPVFKGILT